MYTIKVNAFKYFKIDKSKKDRILYKTFYIEGSGIGVIHRNLEDKNISVDDWLLKHTMKAETWIINSESDTDNVVVLHYYDTVDCFKYVCIWNPADIYIMQNGKTIDKIIV